MWYGSTKHKLAYQKHIEVILARSTMMASSQPSSIFTLSYGPSTTTTSGGFEYPVGDKDSGVMLLALRRAWDSECGHNERWLVGSGMATMEMATCVPNEQVHPSTSSDAIGVGGVESSGERSS